MRKLSAGAGCGLNRCIAGRLAKSLFVATASVAIFLAFPSRAAAQTDCFYLDSPPITDFTMSCEVSTSDTMPGRGSGIEIFTFTNNLQWSSLSPSFELTCSTGVTCVPVCNTDFVYCSGNIITPAITGTVDPEATLRIVVSYTTDASYGTRWVKLTATVSGYSNRDIYKFFQTVNKSQIEPGGAAYSYQSSLAAPSNDFANVYTHSTVPFFTLDQPRSLTLIHNSDKAAPYPLVGVDLLLPRHSLVATSYELSAIRTGGTAFQFTNGETTLKFAGDLYRDSTTYDLYCMRDYAPEYWEPYCITRTQGDSAARFYGRLDLRNEATGLIPVTLTFKIYYSDGSNDTHTINTKLLHVNDGLVSTYGKGWSVAGLQRVYNDSMVVEPGGAVVYFPGGTALDYSTLTTSGGGYVRSYRDGSSAVFNSSGLLIYMTNQFGDTTRFEYASGTDRLVAIKDPQWDRRGHTGTYLQISYDGNNRISQVQEVGVTGGRTTWSSHSLMDTGLSC